MTDEPRFPEHLDWVRFALERRAAVGRQLIGLHLDDARELATRSGYRLRVIRRDGEGLVVTADLDTGRIDVDIEHDIVVGPSAG